MTRRLLLTYLAITAIVLAVLEIPLGVTYSDREEQRLLSLIERDARVIADVVEDTLEGGTGVDPVAVVVEYARTINGRAVIVDTRGISVADSSAPNGPPRDFSTRPEIIAALNNTVATGLRSSQTLGADLIYVAIPVASGSNVFGAVRVSYPRSELDRRVRNNWIRLGALAIAVLAGVAAVGTLLARQVTRPVHRLRQTTARLATGDLGARTGFADDARTLAATPELAALAQDFDEMAERLESLVTSQRAFTADASHQLRTPLTALRLRLENLQADLAESLRADVVAGEDIEAVSDRVTDELEHALGETDRLQRLVDGLLMLARTATVTPPLTAIDVIPIAHDRVTTWEPLAIERGVRLTFSAPSGGLVDAVDGAIEQMLDNLLANAIEATPAGRGVHLQIVPGPARTSLLVSDEGPGMDADQLRRATDRFWRASDSAWDGTGLGLAIVDSLAKQCHGRLHLARNRVGGLDAVVELNTAGRPSGS
ncbi:MAG: ATP-binding protein [Acidimicrobiia bacterium]